uniref:DNA-dependent metalloprotease SPRTN n=1 Tax=Phallusia mammillata TaxID=59560 RepID=A0A6F9DU50_9ASCI|nr:sprT-like domain-containing protein Spartan [Phallusia mammillata]
MGHDDDYALALSLSMQLNDGQRPSPHIPKAASQNRSIVDPELELLDPNPNIHQLFIDFNRTFFWGKLDMVEVKWSPRMTLCAGVCSYQGRGGLCSIRLSKPLLMLRTRKDLVETLLHEMIHAYLFVTDNNTDHDGHGPQFCSHMKRINDRTGTNITIYHSFHDEVDEMRKHWWRCTGTCRSRPPYFGFVKRAMNRKPSPKDFWWSTHQASCSGHFEKVKEPENYGKKKVKTKKVETAVSSQASTSSESMLKFLTQKNNDREVASVQLNGGKDANSETLNGKRVPIKKDKDSKFPLANSTQVTNYRGIPLSSKIFDKFRKGRQDPISLISKTQAQKSKGPLAGVCQNARLTGEKSVNHGAPAFGKFGVITKFLTRKEQRGRILFSSDEDDKIKAHGKSNVSTPKRLQNQDRMETTRIGVKRKSEDSNNDCATQNKRKPVVSMLNNCEEASSSKRDEAHTSSAIKPRANQKVGTKTTSLPRFNTKSKLSSKAEYSLLICDSDDSDTSSGEDDLTLLESISPKVPNKRPELGGGISNLQKTCTCPICNKPMPIETINSHIDLCLNQGALDEIVL